MLSLGAEDFPEQQGLGRAIHKGSGERDHRVSTRDGRAGGRSKRSNSADGLYGVWEWFGVVVLFARGALTGVPLWPFYRMSFRFDAQDLLEEYVDRTPPATLSEMHRSLSLRISSDWHSNGG